MRSAAVTYGLRRAGTSEQATGTRIPTREPSSPESRQGTATDDYQLFGGRYFGESTSLDLAAGATRQTTELTITCVTSLCLSGSAATQIDTDDWSIGALHVRQGSRLSYSITGRVSGADVTASLDSLMLTLPPGTFLPPAPADGTARYHRRGKRGPILDSVHSRLLAHSRARSRYPTNA